MIDKIAPNRTISSVKRTHKRESSNKANNKLTKQQSISTSSTVLQELVKSPTNDKEELRTKIVAHTLTAILGEKSSQTQEFKLLTTKISNLLKTDSLTAQHVEEVQKIVNNSLQSKS